ncbi:MAG: aminopeptidase P family protein [Pseudomonadota bacterium]
MNDTKMRRDRLREELKKQNLAGFIVPLTDEHMSEYVADYAQRLAWLTGFLGSAGSAVVMQNEAAIFVDGRYTIQVAEQVDKQVFEYRHLLDEPPKDWISGRVGAGDRFGIDPWLHSNSFVKSMRDELETRGATLVELESNPIDSIWDDQPERPKGAIRLLDVAFAGETSEQKRAKLAEGLKKTGANHVVLSALDSVAWLFNIRGDDVANTPVAYAFASVDDDGTATLYIDAAKVPPDVREAFDSGISVASREALLDNIAAWGQSGDTIQLDEATNVSALFSAAKASGARIRVAADPAMATKAKKNKTEQEGTRAAHRRDGAALTKFLAWFDKEAPKGELTEISAADKLEAFRREGNLFQDLSFRTISGAGEHGALCHYSVTPESNRPIRTGELYLVDSGGQYLDGTTDVTRTMPVGDVSDDEKRCFTAVLKGHIALATQIFPKGTGGQQLDAIARAPLWELGLDYDHGTGHGVGSYLSVHEGPQRIGKTISMVPLEEGMICSNEPGYYREGAFGIRIENLVLVVPVDTGEDGREFLGFETITLAPINRRLILPSLLTDRERSWLDRYHQRVYAELSPQLDGEAAQYLKAATAPLA